MTLFNQRIYDRVSHAMILPFDYISF